MELRQLAHFLAIVEHGSLGRAARVLNITEPALSKSLKRLEADLQVPLLERGSRGMTPTAFGASLLDHARLVLGEIDSARRRLDEMRGASRGVVRVGMRPSFGATVLPRAIARVRADNPGIHVVVREGFMPNLIHEVTHGELDFVVVSGIADLDPVLLQEPLAASPVGVLALADHPLAARGPLQPGELAEAPWVMPLSSDPIRRELDRVLRDNGLESANVIAETNSVLTTLGCIRECAAIGFFPRLMIEFSQGVDDLAFLDLPALAWQRTLGVVRRRVSLPPAAQVLIDELRAVTAEFGLAVG